MRKRIKIAAVLCVILSLLSTANIYAHPGGTDDAGGHLDHSTGDYHYHHGYSAHDHYDMDGDGDRDCPYDFEDKTGSNSGSNNSSSSNNGYASANKEPQVYYYETEGGNKVPASIWWIIATLCAAVVILLLIIRRKNKELAEQEKRFRQEINDAHISTRDAVIALNAALTRRYGKDYLYVISGAPEGAYVGKDRLPHSHGVDDPYEFYAGGVLQKHPVVYHTANCRYARLEYPINAYTIRESGRGSYQRCAICKPYLPNMDWVKAYRRHQQFIRKYAFTIEDVKF